MAIAETKGVFLRGRMKKDGVTFYTRAGKVIMRSSITVQPHRRTRKQFVARQRLAHNVSLWLSLKDAGTPIFEGGKNRYGRFNTLMRKMPVVFLTKGLQQAGAGLLIPGMPVSDGLLPDIQYELGMVGNSPALLTSLPFGAYDTDVTNGLWGPKKYLKKGDQLWLYRFTQKVYGDVFPVPLPKVSVSLEILDPYDEKNNLLFKGVEFQRVNGCLALVGDVFGDETKGWALVHVNDGHASSQQVVTRSRLYEEYTTEEAFALAAESYGGLTGE